MVILNKNMHQKELQVAKSLFLALMLVAAINSTVTVKITHGSGGGSSELCQRLQKECSSYPQMSLCRINAGHCSQQGVNIFGQSSSHHGQHSHHHSPHHSHHGCRTLSLTCSQNPNHSKCYDNYVRCRKSGVTLKVTDEMRLFKMIRHDSYKDKIYKLQQQLTAKQLMIMRLQQINSVKGQELTNLQRAYQHVRGLLTRIQRKDRTLKKNFKKVAGFATFEKVEINKMAQLHKLSMGMVAKRYRKLLKMYKTMARKDKIAIRQKDDVIRTLHKYIDELKFVHKMDAKVEKAEGQESIELVKKYRKDEAILNYIKTHKNQLRGRGRGRPRRRNPVNSFAKRLYKKELAELNAIERKNTGHGLGIGPKSKGKLNRKQLEKFGMKYARGLFNYEVGKIAGIEKKYAKKARRAHKRKRN